MRSFADADGLEDKIGILAVDAIVAAWNEAATVGGIVTILRRSPFLRKVFVVDDGSEDGTAEAAKAAGAVVIRHETNRGKGEAMLSGLRASNAEVIVFADADLNGLTADHVRLLLDPVLKGTLRMNVGLRDRGRWLTAISAHLPLISGERALYREVMERIPRRLLHGFMVEGALNYSCRSRGEPYGSVRLPGLSIRHKFQKVGWRRSLPQYLIMIWQIGWAMLVVRLLWK